MPRAKAQSRIPKQPQLLTATVREFDGGWNVVADDHSLSPKYSPIVDNIIRAYDGGMQVRYGSKLAVNLDSNHAGYNVVNGFIFKNYLYTVDTHGDIVQTNLATGTQTKVWNTAIAALLPGAPAAWSTTSLVVSDVFGGLLLLYNGIDKPLMIDPSAVIICQYIVDPATGSNAFVHVAQYAVSLSEYVVNAGLPNDGKYDVAFTAKSTYSVFVDNPAPDDATTLDISKITTQPDPTVTGLGAFRGKLLVFSSTGLISAVLGLHPTSSSLHEPAFTDDVARVGTVAHRTIVTIGSDVFMCDLSGVPSLSQSLLSNNLVPSRISSLVEPAIQRNISRLSATTQKNKIFAIYNPREMQYMLFMPRYDDVAVTLPDDPISLNQNTFGIHTAKLYYPGHDKLVGDSVVISGSTNGSYNATFIVAGIIDSDYLTFTTAFSIGTGGSADVRVGGNAVIVTENSTNKVCYCLNYNPRLRVQSWSRFPNYNYTWAACDNFGRIFLGRGTRVFKLGTAEEALAGDEINNNSATYANLTAVFVGVIYYDAASGKTYKCLTSHTTNGANIAADIVNFPTAWEQHKGTAIAFTWEWPWIDFGTRVYVKQLRLVHPEASGTSQFTLELFSDNLYKESYSGALTPRRSLTFYASEYGGYLPTTAGRDSINLARRTKEQRLWAMPIQGKIFKARFSGSTTSPVKFTALSFVHNKAGMQR